MECRNSLSTYVPPSITNRNSLEPFVFSSEVSRMGGIFTKLCGQKKLNEGLVWSTNTPTTACDITDRNLLFQ